MRQMTLAALAVLLTAAAAARAEVQTKTVTYKDGDTTLKGFMAWDDSVEGKRPGVLVVHEWWGLNDYARMRAEKLAKMGYVAFAVDMYGGGKVTEHPETAAKWAGMIRENEQAWRDRAKLGLKVLKEDPKVDDSKLAAIGYCFGGSTALQLAYSGADLDAVVSFHGALPVPTPEQAKAIQAKILICHGAKDGFIPENAIQAVREAFEKGGVDYQMIYYAGAVHSFSVPDADKRGISGIAYNEHADQRSWRHMRQLFHEAFGEKK